MQDVLGVVCVLFGAVGWIGQTISSINFPAAQRMGLQEKTENTDALYRLAEFNAARWDAMVLWILIAAGILMLIDHTWWPYVSLLAGGIYLDASGREAAKYLSLSSGGVKTGTSKEKRNAACFYAAMALLSIWLIAYTLWRLC